MPTPSEKAARTARVATTMAKWRIGFETGGKKIGRSKVKPSRRWQLVTFKGRAGGESKGIVDFLAIRRDFVTPSHPLKHGDLFELILVQVKGGSARLPSRSDVQRLRVVKARYGAKDVVLAQSRQGRPQVFLRLKETLSARWTPSSAWEPVDPGTLFR